MNNNMADLYNKQLVINPQDYHTDVFYTGFLIVFWLIWAPVTVYVTILACKEPGFFFFIVKFLTENGFEFECKNEMENKGVS